ncbi:hypothetical protein AGR8A_Lc10014 [Agrobacterium fabrum str. J-07]|nr:hypothetical protein AGR8A_Lc10014 [Agrobacterium fabrum str. J-07]
MCRFFQKGTDAQVLSEEMSPFAIRATAESGDQSVGIITAEGNVPALSNTIVMIHNKK